jgi:hypothetical protein
MTDKEIMRTLQEEYDIESFFFFFFFFFLGATARCGLWPPSHFLRVS